MMENSKQIGVILSLVRESAIPTEKLSILTVNANMIIDKKLVVLIDLLSFFDKNISIDNKINIIPTR